MIIVANVEIDWTRSRANRPTKMKPIDTTPTSTVAWTRDSRGNTEEKSRPVPYSEVVPVDMPPIRASRHTGRKNQPGEIASSPPTKSGAAGSDVVGGLAAMMLAVPRPKTNGSSVASWERNAAPITRRRGCRRDVARPVAEERPERHRVGEHDQAAPMNDGQNRDWVAASAESVNTPAYEASKSPAKANTPTTNSRVAEVTAILLTNSMNRKPYTQTASTSPANSAYATA